MRRLFRGWSYSFVHGGSPLQSGFELGTELETRQVAQRQGDAEQGLERRAGHFARAQGDQRELDELIELFGGRALRHGDPPFGRAKSEARETEAA